MSWIEGIVECTELGPYCSLNVELIITATIGAVTVVISGLAWHASRKAIAIAKEQHDEIVAARHANSRIIGRLLLQEVTALPDRLERFRCQLAPHAVDDTYGKPSPRELLAVLEEFTAPLLPNAERVIDRIHNLPPKLGADLATTISHARSIASIAERVRSSIKVVRHGISMARTTYNYSGDPGAVTQLIGYIDFWKVSVDVFKEDFSNYVMLDGAGNLSTPGP